MQNQADTPPHQQGIKVSQRPTKSCTECIRRKTRCNKQIPCDVCVKRGVPSLCRLESQYAPSTPAASSSSLALGPVSDIETLRQSVYEEIRSLRKRVSELEKNAELERQRKSVDGQSRSAGGDEAEDAATTLEFFALGLDRRVGDSTNGAQPEKSSHSPVITQIQNSQPATPRLSHILTEPGQSPPDTVTDALLPQRIVHAVLQFHDRNVYWQHACIYSPHLLEEVGVFYDVIDQSGWNRVDGAWIALFYILQAIAVHQMKDAEAVQCGLNEALVSSAMAALHHASFLSRPNIFTCQAIAILCLCGHNVCESDLLSSLLAIGIKTAQSLSLHSLGRLREMDVIEREVGKRVWWALTMEDWFAIPFRGVWSVHPDHFDSPLPSNCHDSDLAAGRIASRPDSEVTIGFKSRFSSQSASILQRTFQRLRHASSTTAFSIASDSANQIRKLISLLPPPHHNSPAWTSDMRHYLLISATHKILVVYRAFLARGGSSSEKALAQSECLKAAEAMIEEIDTRSGSQALWTIPYHTLAAGVVLALEVIGARRKKSDTSSVTRTKKGVEKARKALERLAPTSRIARRGLQVLEDLMKEAEGKRKRGADGMARIVKKIKLPEDILLESAPHSPVEQDVFITPDGIDASLSTEPQLEADPTMTSPLNFDWSSSDMDALLASLQETVPDVGRLFDGSIGNFGFGFAGGAS